ncbi:hypothetical protein AGMMS49991_12180 [Spirochaetia bacterium]|nr:hypothetical protein AGMMS49991_12180 [Spirochaetia bacterium]
MKSIHVLGLSGVLLVLALGFSGCELFEIFGGNENKGGDPALTGSVSITGTTEVGQTLTVNISALGGTGNLAYQWMRGSTDITGATNASYLLDAADLDQTIAVRVSRAGYTGSITRNASSVVTNHGRSEDHTSELQSLRET